MNILTPFQDLPLVERQEVVQLHSALAQARLDGLLWTRQMYALVTVGRYISGGHEWVDPDDKPWRVPLRVETIL